MTLAERLAQLSAESAATHAANSAVLDSVVRGAAFGRADRADHGVVALDPNRPAAESLRGASWLPESGDVGLVDLIRGWAGLGDTHAALSTADSAGIGYLIPTAQTAQIFDRLRPASVLMQAGVQTELVAAGETSFPHWETDPSVSWRVENAEITPSAGTIGLKIAKARSGAALLVVSREALADGGSRLERALIDQLAAVFAAEIDRVGLRGDGVTEPLGILSNGDVPTTSHGSVAIGGYTPLLTLAETILEANAPMPNAFIGSPKTAIDLGGRLLNGEGDPISPPSALAAARLFSTTSAVDSGGATSRVIAGGFDEVRVALREGFSLQVLRERYANQGSIGLVCHVRLDVVIPRPARLAILSNVSES